MACGDQMISVTGGGDALPCCALPLVQHRAAPTLARPWPGAPTAQSRLPPWHRLVASRSLRGPSAWQYYPTFVPPWIWPHATPSRYTKHHVALSAVGCPSMRRTPAVTRGRLGRRVQCHVRRGSGCSTLQGQAGPDRCSRTRAVATSLLRDFPDTFASACSGPITLQARQAVAPSGRSSRLGSCMTGCYWHCEALTLSWAEYSARLRP